MKRFKFGLKFLLLLPVCVAAFWVGWQVRQAELDGRFDRDGDLANANRLEAITRKSNQSTKYQRPGRTDQFEHQQRMRYYDRFLKDPAEAKMHGGRFE